MASVIDPPPGTTPPEPRPDVSDAVLASRSTILAAGGWLAVAACAAGSAASAEYRELLSCGGLLALFAAASFSSDAIFSASRSPGAGRLVLFLEALRRRVTDEPRLDVLPPASRSRSH